MRISSLLARWSEALIRTQAAGTGDPKLDGALICPACRSIHGRCADAMYPFLYMAEATGESRWSDAAASLFAWMENNVSLPSGGFINDVGSDWKGITVFTVIMLLDCLERHPDAMGPSLKVAAEKRLGRAADFLLSFDLMDKNTNYPVSAALALYRSGGIPEHMFKSFVLSVQIGKEMFGTFRKVQDGFKINYLGTRSRYCRKIQ